MSVSYPYIVHFDVYSSDGRGCFHYSKCFLKFDDAVNYYVLRSLEYDMQGKVVSSASISFSRSGFSYGE